MDELSDLYEEGKAGFINPLANNNDVQIDLDNEKNIKALEDPGLIKHMEEARSRLKLLDTEVKKLENQEYMASFNSHDLSVRSSLSQVINTLQSVLMSLKIAAGDTSLECSNALKITKGLTPHGYPATAATLEHFQVMSKRLDKISNDLDDTIESADKMSCELTRARRNYEQLSCLVQANSPLQLQ